MKSIELTQTAQRTFADVALVSGFLSEHGWAVKNSGNISVDMTGDISISVNEMSRFPYKPLEKANPELSRLVLLVTGAGTRMRDVKNDLYKNVCLIQFSDDGSGYYTLNDDAVHSNLHPTSELATHLAIHRFLKKHGRTEKAVLHTHPNELIAMTLIAGFQDEPRLNKMLLSVQPETVMVNPNGVGLIPYTLPGSELLAEKTITSLQHHPIIMWGKHGCLAVGDDVQEAFDLIDVMNRSAQLFFLCRDAGYHPQGLTEQEIEELKKKF